jgi:hypothetical protein
MREQPCRATCSGPTPAARSADPGDDERQRRLTVRDDRQRRRGGTDPGLERLSVRRAPVSSRCSSSVAFRSGTTGRPCSPR